jgi:hypothetical protein
MKSTTIPRLVILLYIIIFSKNSFSQNYSNGDIDINLNYVHSYDSTNCIRNSQATFNVSINNSQLGDTFKLHIIIPTNNGYLCGQKVDSIVNLTGINPWVFSLSPSWFSKALHCDNTISNNNFFPFWFWDHKAILSRKSGTSTSQDTINNIVLKDSIYIANPCNYLSFGGNIFLDHDANCSIDSTDKIILDDNILNISNDNFCSSRHSSLNGSSYLVKVAEKNIKYPITVSLNSDYQFIFPINQCSQVSYTLDSLPQTGLDFALQCGSEIDLYAKSVGPGRARPNKPFEIYSSVGNIGCTEASGQLKLVMDPRVVYDSSGSIHPAEIVLSSPTGDTLVWNFTNLNSFNNGPYWNAFLSAIKVTPLTTVSIGDTLHFNYWTNIPAQDADSSNNQGSFDVEIRTAFDPNEKSVSPKGEGPNGNISPTTQKLKYTIQFQNTGSDYAENIYLIDTLDAAIDPTSLQIEMASHHMNPEWLAPNVVKFNFPYINLLDSTTNEPASHGSVTFNVHLKPNLPVGTQIKNIGYIYFDYNAPVLTNYAISTLYEKSASINENESINGIVLFPNPAQDNISIQSSIELTTAKIISTDGKIVNEFDLTTNQKNLDISSLKFGTYLVEIESTTGYIQRLKFLKK